MNDTTYWKPNSTKSFRINLDKVRSIFKFRKHIGVPSRGKKVLGIALGVFLILLLLSYLVLIKPAMNIMASIQALKSDANTAKIALTNRDLVALEKTLDKTQQDLKLLVTARDANFGWVKNFGPLSSYYRDTDHFVKAGTYLITAGKEAIDLIKPFADAAGLKVKEDQKVQNTGLANAISSWISLMPKVAVDMDKVLAPISSAGKELSLVDANKYPKQLGTVALRSTILTAQTTLTKLADYSPDIKEALTIVPGLLGVGTTEKRYMIIMQNDKEIRATGGFWTNYATFKIKNALLNSDFTSKDMYSIDIALNIIDQYIKFPSAPNAYTKYLKVEHLYARDANISPDLPTSVDRFMYFYKLAMPSAPYDIKPIDGVITMDTQVIRELLGITGPVAVDGVTYNSQNVVLELETIASLGLREQTNRKGVLGRLMQRMLLNVFESDKDLWPKLIEKAIDLGARKHVQAYMFDPKAQALLEKYNLAGRIADSVNGDYSMVVSTNLGGDKTNWFVNKKVDHVLSKDTKGKWMDTVTIKYAYDQPAPEFANFVKRFRDWVRVYAPLGSQFIGVDGSQDGTTTDQERNKVWYSGYLELGPGETGQLSFKYYLPEGLVKGDTYTLYLVKQAGIDHETHTVTVNGRTVSVDLKSDYTFTANL